MTKNILITGASRGIGKEISLSLAKQKDTCIVINCARSFEELSKVYDEIISINKNVHMMKCDLSDYNITKKNYEKIKEKIGSIDILINNAGVSSMGLFNLQTNKDINYILDNNIKSFLNMTNIVTKDMVYKQKGSIINISSIWGEKGAAMEVLYSMSKGAINTFTKALARELAPSNIRVNAISCGLIDTSMNSFLKEQDLLSFIEEIPISRMGQPKDISNLCEFLISNNSNYITGQIINVDGGFL